MKIAMKYPGAKNEISIESARYLYENQDEISIERGNIFHFSHP